ncbi:hypothetical protein LSAT2_014625 [Lamellibrachia satsuma]|nr:hypothetical protein LSAT2_014625 [Lamellibrachia satsuma]
MSNICIFFADCEYWIRTVTGDNLIAGTHANVDVKLRGSLRTSRWVRLQNTKDKFGRGKSGFFLITCRCVGYQRSIQLRHDNKGTGPAWYLKTVDVKNWSKWSLAAHAYQCNTWLSKYSGLSKQFWSPRKVLTRFVVATSIGFVSRLYVRHDNSGVDPSWYLKYITVENRATYETFKCYCYKWLKTGSLSTTLKCYLVG